METPKKILVVVDDQVILRILSLKLKENGFQVFTAVEASQAIGMVRDQQPDLILLDINFPPDVGAGGGVSWDGFRILEWFHHMDNVQVVPVIIISSVDAAKCKARVLKAGAAGFFQKPLDHEALLAAIHTLLLEKATGCPPALTVDWGSPTEGGTQGEQCRHRQPTIGAAQRPAGGGRG